MTSKQPPKKERVSVTKKRKKKLPLAKRRSRFVWQNGDLEVILPEQGGNRVEDDHSPGRRRHPSRDAHESPDEENGPRESDR
jgi:hypothetical protein